MAAMTAQAQQLASFGPMSSPNSRLAQEPNPFEQSFSLLDPKPSFVKTEPPTQHPYPVPNYSREPSVSYQTHNPADYTVEYPWGDPNSVPYTRRGVGGRKRKPTQGMDPKKIQFLERNRQAALKCRLRKKRRLETTQMKRSVLDHQNMQLEAMAQELRFQCSQLRSMIASHINCPTFQRLSTYPAQAPAHLPPF
ncbi:Transcription factor [Entomophthora muscae]|uniref:Transcription factor n=1 Tax=Entomophthora muscae TaxID=34485 RepID=A0ACC2SED7_9FUNG|nr:Transcription factor [Entomophthora muscae]